MSCVTPVTFELYWCWGRQHTTNRQSGRSLPSCRYDRKSGAMSPQLYQSCKYHVSTCLRYGTCTIPVGIHQFDLILMLKCSLICDHVGSSLFHIRDGAPRALDTTLVVDTISPLLSYQDEEVSEAPAVSIQRPVDLNSFFVWWRRS